MQEKGNQLSKPSESALPRIQMALAQMAILRGTKLDKETLSLYSRRLVTERIDDVLSAIEQIAEMARAEGDPAFPPMATILAVVGAAAIARHNRHSLGQDRALVMWRCGVCGYTATGFLTQLDIPFRTCPSRLGPLLPADAPRINGQRPQRMQLGQDQRCGAELQVVCDERRTQGA
jgi:hypothetical protein